MTSVLKYEVEGSIATLTLNRPEVHNALDPELLCRFVDALADFDRNPQLRVAIITGAGAQAFCAGGDLGSTLPLLTGDRTPQNAWEQRLLDDPAVKTIAPLRERPINKPVIAAVNGLCMAAGAEIMLGTDIRVIAEHATVAWPEVRRGLIPFAGSLVRLSRHIPYCHAMELLLTGCVISAADALRMGLVNHVVPGEQVMTRAMEIAQKIAANAPLAVQQIKRVAIQADGSTLAAGFQMEEEGFRTVMGSADAREGARAFMEKRAPAYTGK
ncbi:enoyl-CoA hydratase/isomerase family protein [Undibacterium sp. TJN25]|uniref:enoyl-CoA hydratase/isomerase family protein n=1 Tax=Undibacterium sp. TJN25 TaxID=3413056 RepID=UPI003BF33EAC